MFGFKLELPRKEMFKVVKLRHVLRFATVSEQAA